MPLINAGFNRVSNNMCVNVCVLLPVFEVFLCFIKFLDIPNVDIVRLKILSVCSFLRLVH